MKKIVTRYDVFVICGVIVLAFFLYGLTAFNFWNEQPDYVEINVDGKAYATYFLSEISETKYVDIKSDAGKNVLEITNSGARMIQSTCKDKIDVQSGKISKPGQMLVCVPNRVTVRIVGKNMSDVDKVTY